MKQTDKLKIIRRAIRRLNAFVTIAERRNNIIEAKEMFEEALVLNILLEEQILLYGESDEVPKGLVKWLNGVDK